MVCGRGTVHEYLLQWVWCTGFVAINNCLLPLLSVTPLLQYTHAQHSQPPHAQITCTHTQITCTHTQITCTPTHPHTNADPSVAVVWVDGQQAVITFTSNRDDTSTAYVSANTSHTYAIHRNPVDYTLNPAIRCTLDYIGDNITQPLNLRQDATDHTVNIELTEMYFQSVAVYNVDGSVLACGTIFTSVDLDRPAVKAVFTSVVAGTVYLVDIGSECVNTATMYCKLSVVCTVLQCWCCACGNNHGPCAYVHCSDVLFCVHAYV